MTSENYDQSKNSIANQVSSWASRLLRRVGAVMMVPTSGKGEEFPGRPPASFISIESDEASTPMMSDAEVDAMQMRHREGFQEFQDALRLLRSDPEREAQVLDWFVNGFESRVLKTGRFAVDVAVAGDIE